MVMVDCRLLPNDQSVDDDNYSDVWRSLYRCVLFVCTYVCMHVRVCACMCVYVYVCVCVCLCLSVCMCKHLHVYVYLSVCVCSALRRPRSHY